MTKKKIIVWDLFGGGQNSVYNGLRNSKKFKNFEIYTFDVTKPTRKNHIKIDLAQPDIVEKMRKFPRPDIIVSSPLCQSFSCVLNMKGGGTCFWKLNKSKTKLIKRSRAEFERLKSGFTKNLKADVQEFIAKLGKKCIDNTINIIKEYQPKVWYIENPKHSLMWKYITLNRKDFYDPKTCYLNPVSYGKYGYLTTKMTILLSNVKLNLLTGKIEPPYTVVTDANGDKWYVLKDDPTKKVRRDLDSRMIGLANLKTMIKARNAKSGMGAMDFVMRNSKSPAQKNKKVNEQISEAGPASAIPPDLIKEVFGQFITSKELK